MTNTYSHRRKGTEDLKLVWYTPAQKARLMEHKPWSLHQKRSLVLTALIENPTRTFRSLREEFGVANALIYTVKKQRELYGDPLFPGDIYDRMSRHMFDKDEDIMIFDEFLDFVRVKYKTKNPQRALIKHFLEVMKDD